MQVSGGIRFELLQHLLDLLLLSAICLFAASAEAVELGELDLTVVDAETKQPIAARLLIQDDRGRPPRIRNVPRLGNEFTFRDTLTFELKRGKYHFVVEHGPQYKQQSGYLQVDRDGFDQKTIALPRFANLKKKGYYAGDLFCSRDAEHTGLLMAAEELHLLARPSWSPGVPFTQYTSKRDRSIQQDEESVTIQDHSAGTLEIDGGRLVFANLNKDQILPADFGKTAFSAATLAKSLGNAHVAVLEPWAWDLPMLVAHDLVDSVAILTESLEARPVKKRTRGPKHKGYPIDDELFIGAFAKGQFAEHIYFQLLNCGLRIAPSASSGSGTTQNPPGYNRAYVACGADFSAANWYRNLEKGKSIISNGPVLSVRVNEQLPGHVFQSDSALTLEVTCDLATRQKVEYLEIIRNGRTTESVRLDKWAAAGGVLPLVRFEESGWLAVRAHAADEPNYRSAISAPFYVEIGGKKRVSKKSAEFFAKWVLQRAKQLKEAGLPKAEQRELLNQQKFAYEYWKQLAEKANAK